MGGAVSAISNAVNQVTQSVGQVAEQSTRAIANTATLQLDKVPENLARTGGAVMGSNPVTAFSSQGPVQNFLERPDIGRATLGLSQDYAGSVRGVYELRDTGSMSRESFDDTVRGGAKLYGGYLASGISSTTATKYSGYAKDASLAGSGISALSRGDYRGAVNSFSGVSGDYGLPQLPKAPDWVGDAYDRYINLPVSDVSDPSEFNPWRFTGDVADSGLQAKDFNTESSKAYLVVLIGLGLFLFIKGKK